SGHCSRCSYLIPQLGLLKNRHKKRPRSGVLSGLWNKNFSSNDYSLQIADTQLRARAAIAARAARMVIAMRVNVFMGNIMAKGSW
ncbi:MAG TPA: hypothetical protein PK031_09840, partial [Pseudomonadales bacterium]|nr:hypothetical protein [Pseudomonadales bacterium]